MSNVFVAVRVRPTHIDPAVSKGGSATTNVLMIDQNRVGFSPDLLDHQQPSQKKRLNALLVREATHHRGKQTPGGKTVQATTTFVYDACFGPQECFDESARIFNNAPSTSDRGSQEHIFSTMGTPAVDTILKGFHCCILAYGQTGSGKTYSMLGPSRHDNRPVSDPSYLAFTSDRRRSTPRLLSPSTPREGSVVDLLKGNADRGLIIRIVEDIILKLKSKSLNDGAFRFSIIGSYYQIFKEKVWDLLTGSTEVPLRMRFNEKLGPVLENVTEVSISSVDDMLRLLDRGLQNRRVASTHHNVHSSRSHAILSLSVRCGTKKDSVHSTIYFADLAGSERIGHLVNNDRNHSRKRSSVLNSGRPQSAKQKLFTDEERWQAIAANQIAEASDINSSLTSLGKVINVLAESQRTKTQPRYVPYRDSILTMVLRNSFGGNAFTFMLATVSPFLRDSEETLSTLRFINRARAVVNCPLRNNQRTRDAEIDSLRAENVALRAQIDDLMGQLKCRVSGSLSSSEESPVKADSYRAVRRLANRLEESEALMQVCISSEEKFAKTFDLARDEFVTRPDDPFVDEPPPNRLSQLNSTQLPKRSAGDHQKYSSFAGLTPSCPTSISSDRPKSTRQRSFSTSSDSEDERVEALIRNMRVEIGELRQQSRQSNPSPSVQTQRASPQPVAPTSQATRKEPLLSNRVVTKFP